MEVDREEEDEEGVRSRPPITGEGRRAREREATPGACEGGGREGRAGEEEDKEEGGEGEEGLLGGRVRAGESTSWPEWVKDRFLLGPASCPPGSPAPPPPLPPLPPVIAVVVAMTINAFCGSATVVMLLHWSP